MRFNAFVAIVGVGILVLAAPLIMTTDGLSAERLTSFQADHFAPDIHGRNVVWQDMREHNGDIYTYDLGADGVPYTIDDAGGDKWEVPVHVGPGDQLNPAVYGQHIVWEDMNIGAGDIVMYDMGSDGVFNSSDDVGVQTLSSDPDQQTMPDVWGDYVVWQDDRNGADRSEIRMYKISTGEESTLPKAFNGDCHDPAIGSDYVVWSESPPGAAGSSIAYYDLNTETTEYIDSNTDNFYPSVWGDNIAFLNYNVGAGEQTVSLYDISVKTWVNITSYPSLAAAPAIYGNNIAWIEDTKDNVTVYSISEMTTENINAEIGSSQTVAINDKLIVWPDVTRINSLVYSARLTPPTEPVINDLSTIGMNNNTFVFLIDMEWEQAILETWIMYSINSPGSDDYNMSMIRDTDDPLSFTKEIPLEEDAEKICYKIVIRDTDGNWFTSSEETISLSEDVSEQGAFPLYAIVIAGVIVAVGLILVARKKV